MNIVGGSYFEKCTWPPWDDLFGSGGRAAAALSAMDTDIILDTFVGDNGRDQLSVLAATYNFSVVEHRIASSLSFRYDHSLSEPRIFPTIYPSVPPIEIQADSLLRFGFLEGDAVISAKKAVYDPQNTERPEFFRTNGSKAEQLAIVANAGQCKTMVGESDLANVGRRLLAHESADVVVIKRGSFGALVITTSSCEEIPAFRTENVWKIGSGDVFAAVFAHFWMNKSLDPTESARLASLATANYCQTKRLPIPSDFMSTTDFEPIGRSNNFPIEPRRIYLAGPFFTLPSLWLVVEARKYLTEQGFIVFSPYHDVGTGSALEVAPADIRGLEECHMVFAIVDGLDPGTVFEIGYARSLGKPVIVFVQNESEENLKMLEGSDCVIVHDFASAIYQANWTAMQI